LRGIPIPRGGDDDDDVDADVDVDDVDGMEVLASSLVDNGVVDSGGSA
jgi:hypothetical protein